MSKLQAVPPAISIARTALAGLLASEPESIDLRLAVAQALSELEDVRPPYPPLDYSAPPPLDLQSEIQYVYRHLRMAIDTAETIEQVMACSGAARSLAPFLSSGKTS
jgi:hypothetical protein